LQKEKKIFIAIFILVFRELLETAKEFIEKAREFLNSIIINNSNAMLIILAAEPDNRCNYEGSVVYLKETVLRVMPRV